MADDVRSGCLVLADVGGYTRYLGGVELEHSHDILADLIGAIAARLGDSLRVVKLEGDAIFCCDRDGGTDGPALVGAIESAYFAFARRQRTIGQASGCECDACRRIPELNLKFLAHHGVWVEHTVAGSSELVGSDVIVAHRLLKNSVGEQTGLGAYALITEACVQALAIDADAAAMRPHVERYDDVGEIEARLLDLEERWAREQQRDMLKLDDADCDLVLEATVTADAATTWNALTVPAEQQRWRIAVVRVEQQHPGGGRGAGTTTHCVHGDYTITQEILDWRPPHYQSFSERNPLGPCLWTIELEPLDTGTRVIWRIKLAGGLGQRALYTLAGRRRMQRILRQNLDALAAYLEPAPGRPG